MKINGNHPSHHVDNLKRSKTKGAGKSEGFQDSLDKVKTTSDTVKTGGLTPAPTTYVDPTRKAAIVPKKSESQAQSDADIKAGKMVEAKSLAQDVLRTPEAASARVDEIKKLIQEGGGEAYFRSIDSEKVAERLLKIGRAHV